MALHVLRLDRAPRAFPIFDQLVLEEALFRADDKNWCILNRGCGCTPSALDLPGPASRSAATVVMGIGGKPERLLDLSAVQRDSVGVIRRFTGGGTVVVGKGTLFATFILNKGALQQRGLPDASFPRPIMEWSARFYKPIFDRLCSSELVFGLNENDYVLKAARIGGAGHSEGGAPEQRTRKFGGNAQSISRGRWVHHTSFLWDYDPTHMTYLQLPEKRPAYRADRDHHSFEVGQQVEVEQTIVAY